MGFVSSDFMYVRKPSGTPQPRRKNLGDLSPRPVDGRNVYRGFRCVFRQSLGPSH